jgi:hypothetical protein
MPIACSQVSPALRFDVTAEDDPRRAEFDPKANRNAIALALGCPEDVDGQKASVSSHRPDRILRMTSVGQASA